MPQTTQLSCICGQVQLKVDSAPIVNAECCCNSCRIAGARLQTLPSAPSIVDAKGATRFVLYRKDRIRFGRGAEHLKEFRLTPASKTHVESSQRVAARQFFWNFTTAIGSASIAASGLKERYPRSKCAP
jgi:hypothetical protein